MTTKGVGGSDGKIGLYYRFDRGEICPRLFLYWRGGWRISRRISRAGARAPRRAPCPFPRIRKTDTDRTTDSRADTGFPFFFFFTEKSFSVRVLKISTAETFRTISLESCRELRYSILFSVGLRLESIRITRNRVFFFFFLPSTNRYRLFQSKLWRNGTFFFTFKPKWWKKHFTRSLTPKKTIEFVSSFSRFRRKRNFDLSYGLFGSTGQNTVFLSFKSNLLSNLFF